MKNDSSHRYNVQLAVPFNGMVKILVWINGLIWFLFQILGEKLFFQKPFFTIYLSLIPGDILYNFQLWRPLTYMFLHSNQWTHIVFNMLMLWFIGFELEQLWGKHFFLLYYLVTGIGAAVLYILGISIYVLFTGQPQPLMTPVIGASGAIYGLMMAYGLLFGERIIYFMMLFPMKAKFFVLILGIIQVVTLLSSGLSGDVAVLAHLGGLIVGFVFLKFLNWYQKRHLKNVRKNGRNLRLVVDNNESQKEPRYWN